MNTSLVHNQDSALHYVPVLLHGFTMIKNIVIVMTAITRGE